MKLRKISGALAIFLVAYVILQVAAGQIESWPRWLELPWSDMEDFAVGADGTVAVFSSYFGRVLLYDSSGRFVRSLEAPKPRGWSDLATSAAGSLFLRNGDSVWIMPGFSDIPPPRFLLIDASKAPTHGWMLDENLQIFPAPGPDHLASEVDRVGGAFDLIFAPEVGPRTDFLGSDGTRYERAGDQIVVQTASGARWVLRTPWFLYWLKMPIPGVLSWIVIFVFAFFFDSKSKKKLGRSIFHKSEDRKLEDGIEAPGHGRRLR